MRKALTLAETTFANEHLLKQIIPAVADSLGCAYPEIPSKQTAILELIAHEQEIFKSLRQSSSKAFKEISSLYPQLRDLDLIECPGFVPAYKELQAVKDTFRNSKIPGDFLYKLSDTYGLTEEHFEKLAQIELLTYSIDDYQEEVARAKQKAKGALNANLVSDQLLLSYNNSLKDLTKTLTPTNNSYKYNYKYDSKEKEYKMPALETKVLGILYNDVRVAEVVCNGQSNMPDNLSVITESSNFYYESGGQQSDKGVLIVTNASNERLELNVCDVHLINNCVVHICELPAEKSYFALALGDNVELMVDMKHRKRNMCHHTGKYLLLVYLCGSRKLL